MTTTQEPTNALATRALSDTQIRTRIELNKRAGWGLAKGTPDQLNMVFLYCQHHDLLPGDDVTLQDGQPWLTVDGRVKLMRRHKDEYRGHSTRPFTKDEKELWGYDPEDIVIEATIRTVTYGEIKAQGKVSKAERLGLQTGQRLNPVARHHPVEMAIKRALSRAERYTFGTDDFVDDEDLQAAARVVIEQRQDPAIVTRNAEKYDQVWGRDDDGTAFADALVPRQTNSGGDVINTNTGEVIQERAPELDADVAELPEDVCGARGCTNAVRDQAGNTLNDNQRNLMRQRFGTILCRDHAKSTPEQPAGQAEL